MLLLATLLIGAAPRGKEAARERTLASLETLADDLDGLLHAAERTNLWGSHRFKCEDAKCEECLEHQCRLWICYGERMDCPDHFRCIEPAEVGPPWPYKEEEDSRSCYAAGSSRSDGALPMGYMKRTIIRSMSSIMGRHHD